MHPVKPMEAYGYWELLLAFPPAVSRENEQGERLERGAVGPQAHDPRAVPVRADVDLPPVAGDEREAAAVGEGIRRDGGHGRGRPHQDRSRRLGRHGLAGARVRSGDRGGDRQRAGAGGRVAQDEVLRPVRGDAHRRRRPADRVDRAFARGGHRGEHPVEDPRPLVPGGDDHLHLVTDGGAGGGRERDPERGGDAVHDEVRARERPPAPRALHREVVPAHRESRRDPRAQRARVHPRDVEELRRAEPGAVARVHVRSPPSADCTPRTWKPSPAISIAVSTVAKPAAGETAVGTGAPGAVGPRAAGARGEHREERGLRTRHSGTRARG